MPAPAPALYGAASVALGAPGAGILSTVPVGGYASYNGTSMATPPPVTGAAALLNAASPATSSAQIRQALLDSAAPTASLSGRTVTGGRLDIAAAPDRLGLGGEPTIPTPPTDLTIWGTTGNDLITGKAGNDRRAGVSQSGTSASKLGGRQIDTLTADCPPGRGESPPCCARVHPRNHQQLDHLRLSGG